MYCTHNSSAHAGYSCLFKRDIITSSYSYSKTLTSHRVKWLLIEFKEKTKRKKLTWKKNLLELQKIRIMQLIIVKILP